MRASGAIDQQMVLFLAEAHEIKTTVECPLYWERILTGYGRPATHGQAVYQHGLPRQRIFDLFSCCQTRLRQ